MDINIWTSFYFYFQNGDSPQYVTDRLHQFSDPLARFQPINGELFSLIFVSKQIFFRDEIVSWSFLSIINPDVSIRESVLAYECMHEGWNLIDEGYRQAINSEWISRESIFIYTWGNCIGDKSKLFRKRKCFDRWKGWQGDQWKGYLLNCGGWWSLSYAKSRLSCFLTSYVHPLTTLTNIDDLLWLLAPIFLSFSLSTRKPHPPSLSSLELTIFSWGYISPLANEFHHTPTFVFPWFNVKTIQTLPRVDHNR